MLDCVSISMVARILRIALEVGPKVSEGYCSGKRRVSENELWAGGDEDFDVIHCTTDFWQDFRCMVVGGGGKG